jgi:DNA-directed RNA polymerase subunit RPC12/RpoP
MKQPLHTGQLVITPEDYRYIPNDIGSLVATLDTMDFIETDMKEDDPASYRLGNRFMQLVTFLGCSPAIQLEPDAEGTPYCYMVLEGPYEHPHFLNGRNTRPPRCSACGKGIDDWREQLNTSDDTLTESPITCPKCGQQQSPASCNWRQTAGFGRFFVVIENIFPQEAIPSPELLTILSQASNQQSWHYFFLQKQTL